jgi:hypothetical protein
MQRASLLKAQQGPAQTRRLRVAFCFALAKHPIPTSLVGVCAIALSQAGLAVPDESALGSSNSSTATARSTAGVACPLSYSARKGFGGEIIFAADLMKIDAFDPN